MWASNSVIWGTFEEVPPDLPYSRNGVRMPRLSGILAPFWKIQAEVAKSEVLSVLVHVLIALLEAASIGVFICQVAYEAPKSLFWAQFGFSICFLLIWALEAPIISRGLWSWYTLCNAATAGYQIVLTVAIIWTDEAYGMYVPFFLRAWVFRIFFNSAMSYIYAENPWFQIWRHFLRHFTALLCLLMSAAFVLQQIEKEEMEMTLVSAFYAIVVTFSTVGYGDMAPTTRTGRLFIMIAIFTGTAVLPNYLSHFQLTARLWEALNKYEGKPRHVIVAGEITLKEMTLIVEAFGRQSHDRAMCFVSSNRLSRRMELLQRNPKYSGRIWCVQGDIASRVTLERAKADKAGALIILSEKHALCCRGDYKALRSSLAVSRLEKRLPQYLWLRWGTHDHFLPNINYAVHRELLKHSVIGLAMVLPGVVPLLVNLIRSSVFDRNLLPKKLFSTEMMYNWQSLYRFSRCCRLAYIEAEGAIVGASFESCVLELNKKYNILPIGIADANFSNFRLSPRNVIVSESDKLLIMSSSGAQFRSLLDDLHDGVPFCFSSWQEVQFGSRKVAISGESGKYVFIDQTTSIGSPEFSNHEQYLNSKFTAENLFTVLSTISYLRPSCTVSHLGMTSIPPWLQDRWTEAGHPRINQYFGVGTSRSVIYQAISLDTKGILVFSSAKGQREFKDAPLFSVDTRIRAELRNEEDILPANTLVDLHSFTSCKFLPPVHEDKLWAEESDQDFQNCRSFMMGRVISCDMFQTIPILQIENPLCGSLFDTLLGLGSSRSQRPVSVTEPISDSNCCNRETRVVTMNNDVEPCATFGEALSKHIVKSGAIVVSVFRMFNPGSRSRARYQIINPPSELPLLKSDILYAFN